MIALQEKGYDAALAHLQQANQQDPYVLYRMGLAHEGKGDGAKAKELFRKAADFNGLPTLNSAFARAKTRKLKA
jgi:tetratricopeptide (TPR) repeat protein